MSVLLVDDEPHVTEGVETLLNAGGIEGILTCNDSRNVPAILAGNDVGVMLLDLWMPHVRGEQILDLCIEEYPDIPVIIFTGANDIETAVRCVKAGAFDYMVKPVDNARLITAVSRARELAELRRDNARLSAGLLRPKLADPNVFAEIVTKNGAMEGIFRYIESIAASAKPVLITGETGTGKELMARAIHRASRRAGEFVAVNVAGLDDAVFSDTLFGHHRGAFTGADTTRGGLIEKAEGGTLLLDEIGDLALSSQVKLLRLLEAREYFPLGSDTARRAGAHIVLATNLSAEDLRDKARFRRDLYYRLKTHHIHLPPLRERREDLPLLVEHFLEKAAAAIGKRRPTPPRELYQLLGLYDFPGNIRELEAMVHDAVSQHTARVLSLDTFKAHIKRDLPKSARQTPEAGHTAMAFGDALPTLQEATDLIIEEALRRAGNNKSLAADMLGISRTTLNNRLRALRM
jgi:DNA-binding NtrC family response regulator